MRNMRSVMIAFIALMLTSRALAVTFTDGVPLYTSEDLNRMFGSPPQGPSTPVDKSTPEDWVAIQQFIDHQYARLDAERQYDLQRRAMEPAEAPQGMTGGYLPGYYGGYYYPSLGLGYPASTWWNNVAGHYYRPQNPQLPFGNRQLPRALPPGGLYPTLTSHPTYHPNRPIVHGAPMGAPRPR